MTEQDRLRLTGADAARWCLDHPYDNAHPFNCLVAGHREMMWSVWKNGFANEGGVVDGEFGNLVWTPADPATAKQPCVCDIRVCPYGECPVKE